MFGKSPPPPPPHLHRHRPPPLLTIQPEARSRRMVRVGSMLSTSPCGKPMHYMRERRRKWNKMARAPFVRSAAGMRGTHTHRGEAEVYATSEPLPAPPLVHAGRHVLQSQPPAVGTRPVSPPPARPPHLDLHPLWVHQLHMVSRYKWPRHELRHAARDSRGLSSRVRRHERAACQPPAALVQTIKGQPGASDASDLMCPW